VQDGLLVHDDWGLYPLGMAPSAYAPCSKGEADHRLVAVLKLVN
jgi:hypothetical protein